MAVVAGVRVTHSIAATHLHAPQEKLVRHGYSNPAAQAAMQICDLRGVAVRASPWPEHTVNAVTWQFGLQSFVRKHNMTAGIFKDVFAEAWTAAKLYSVPCQVNH